MNQDRLSSSPVALELAKYKPLAQWSPKLGDFIIWHGWVRSWYGVVNSIYTKEVGVIREGLPQLLFTMSEADQEDKTIKVKIAKIRSSRGGEYCVLQDGIWHIC
jgi:hypothetical protein